MPRFRFDLRLFGGDATSLPFLEDWLQNVFCSALEHVTLPNKVLAIAPYGAAPAAEDEMLVVTEVLSQANNLMACRNNIALRLSLARALKWISCRAAAQCCDGCWLQYSAESTGSQRRARGSNASSADGICNEGFLLKGDQLQPTLPCPHLSLPCS